MPFTKSNAVFVKNGHPLFKKYYNKENYYNTLTNYDEDSLERISLWKQKKNKKIYSKQEIVYKFKDKFSN